MFGNGKTSLRGGFGISYEGTLQKRLSLTRWNLPFYSLNQVSNFLDNNPEGKVVYGPVGGGTPTFSGTAPPAQHSAREPRRLETSPGGTPPTRKHRASRLSFFRTASATPT